MNNQKHIQVILVDENDNQIGLMEKMEAHQKGLLHRAVSVFISNSNGEWLLQRRALSKYHSNGLWSNTCCSHPLPGENAEDAAQRRLKEEMGMHCKLTKRHHFLYKVKLENELTEHELDHIFVGVTDETPIANPEEVEEWKYMHPDEIIKDIKKNPGRYSYWFRYIIDNVTLNLIS